MSYLFLMKQRPKLNGIVAGVPSIRLNNNTKLVVSFDLPFVIYQV